MANQTVNHQMEIRAIQNLLRFHGAWFFKVLGGLGSRPGIPDILACLLGRLVAIEVKTGTGRLSEHQAREKGRIEESGGLFILANSVGDVERALVREGLIPPPLIW